MTVSRNGNRASGGGRSHRWWGRLIAVVGASVLSLAGVAVGVAPANAAAGTPAAVTSATFQNSSFKDQSVQRLDIEWAAAASPATPTVSLQFALPPELIGQSAVFAIDNGSCTVTSSTVTCTVDDAYIEQNPYNVHGSFTMGVKVDLKNEESQTGKVFTIDGVDTNPVDITTNFCTTNCSYNGSGIGKWGTYNNSDDTITWTVQVPTSGAGLTTASDGISLAKGQPVTVTDTFGGNPFTVQGAPTVRASGCVTTDSWGYETPSYRTVTSGVTVSPDNTSVTFTTLPGGCTGSESGTNAKALVGTVWIVKWTVKADDGGKGVIAAGKYRNTATITAGGQSTDTSGTAQRYTYGGTATGENFGRFQVTKSFDLGSHVLQPKAVTMNYTIDYPGGTPPSTSGTFTLDASNSWTYTSPEIFKGSMVTLWEENPGPANVDWTFNLKNAAGESVATGVPGPNNPYIYTVQGHTVGSFALVDSASVPLQSQNAKKSLVNPDGVTIPKGTTFQLNASWPDDPALGIKAGSQSIALPADGTTVPFTGLPVGANVTFAETAPAGILGATWKGSSVSPSQLTIGPGSTGVTVTATNTLERNVGMFSLTKDLTGDAAGLVKDKNFTIDYSWPANPALGIEAGSGTATVAAGGTATTVKAPAGAVVTLSEKPVKIEGGTWAEPKFAPSHTVTITQNATVAVTVTNLISLDAGDFTVHKVVNGTGASLLPAGSEFTVHYSFPAGTGFEAGSGEMTVKADGTASSPALPYGAVVTLTEDAPKGVDGATWSKPVFSPDTLTIGDGTTATVTLTNTLSKNAVPGGLAETGSDAAGFAMLSAALLAAGGAFLLIRRRRA